LTVIGWAAECFPTNKLLNVSATGVTERWGSGRTTRYVCGSNDLPGIVDGVCVTVRAAHLVECAEVGDCAYTPQCRMVISVARNIALSNDLARGVDSERLPPQFRRECQDR
jgi:hypothetical protein